MIITSALLLLISTHNISETYEEFARLSNQLSDRIEWIDHNGSTYLTKSQARKKLAKLSTSADDTDISKKHFSTWRNGKCYWIFQLITPSEDYRIFFFCRRDKQGTSRVTKIKVS